MTYLIIEKFYPEKVKALYKKFEDHGRLLPEGVTYVSSWIDEQIETCYQIMESDSREKLIAWINLWEDFAAFEIIPVISSAQAKEKVLASQNIGQD
jgi:hypothetical protein